MSGIRIPTRWILEMAEQIKANPELGEIVFTNEGGNVLQATRKTGPYDPDVKQRLKIDREVWDSWDFEYNPGD